MAMRDIFTGGACNVGDQQSSQRQNNPMRGFIDNMIIDQSLNRQKFGQFDPNVQENVFIQQQILQRQQQMQSMNQEWNNLENEFDQKTKLTMNTMQEQFLAEQMRQDELRRAMNFEQQKIWEQEQINYHEQQQRLINEQHKAWDESLQQQTSDKWATEMNMQQALLDAEEQEEQQRLKKEIEQDSIKNSAQAMMDVMMKDEDPKFQNSKFLQFLSKLSDGSYKIEENKLITDGSELNNVQLQMENVFKDETQKKHEQLNLQNQVWNQEETKINEDQKINFNQAWEDAEVDENEFQLMMQKEYQRVMEEMNNEHNQYEDIWQDSEYQMYQQYKERPDQYIFQKDNPYLNSENPLKEAIQLIAQGKNSDAIIALEASLQKNNKDPQSWRILGRLHQENDQDQQAVACLLNAHKLQPSNLDTLLQLGVSCTNILDEFKAMDYLKLWIINNEQYKFLNVNPQIVPANKQQSDLMAEDIKMINMNMINLFNEARLVKPNDPELLTSLSVLYFISRDYDQAVTFFKEALIQDPSNYSLWNKLGATLAHLGRPDEAMQAYYKALDIKPNYVRVWVNLGIAHSYKGEYEEAARFYLNAISFNPQAKHLWNYLHTTFVCLNRFDLLEKIKTQDVNHFKNEFDIMRVEDLPKPEIEYLDATKEYLIKSDVNAWINEFKFSENSN